MRYWWVNQGATYRHEVPGGYMWSPKRNNNDSFSPYYHNMTLVDPGDIVLSYAGARIKAIGVAVSASYESPKPAEFGTAWQPVVDTAAGPGETDEASAA